MFSLSVLVLLLEFFYFAIYSEFAASFEENFVHMAGGYFGSGRRGGEVCWPSTFIMHAFCPPILFIKLR